MRLSFEHYGAIPLSSMIRTSGADGLAGTFGDGGGVAGGGHGEGIVGRGEEGVELGQSALKLRFLADDQAMGLKTTTGSRLRTA
jgi:hypothetical protein